MRVDLIWQISRPDNPSNMEFNNLINILFKIENFKSIEKMGARE